MKRLVTLFKGQFSSKGDGNTRTYEADDSLTLVLGQAKDIRLHAYTFVKDNNAVATLRLYESSIEGPPDAFGKQLNDPNGYVLTNSDCYLVTVSGPFCGRLRAMLEVKDSAAANPMSITIEVGATLIIE
jgi:hypothetical protein